MALGELAPPAAIGVGEPRFGELEDDEGRGVEGAPSLHPLAIDANEQIKGGAGAEDVEQGRRDQPGEHLQEPAAEGGWAGGIHRR